MDAQRKRALAIAGLLVYVLTAAPGTRTAGREGPPQIELAISEGIGVSDTSAQAPPAGVGGSENVSIGDVVGVFGPQSLTTTEGVAVSEVVGVFPPSVVVVDESVGVADVVSVEVPTPCGPRCT